MATSSMNNLTTLIKRLEAATSRLEDMAQTTTEPGVAAVIANGTGAAGAAAGGAMGATAGALAATSSGVGPAEVLPASIEGFDTLINDQVTKFVNLSEELGGVVAEQASGVLRAFGAERQILIVATRAKKPDVSSSTYMEILTDLQRQISKVCDIRETNRASPFFNHLSAVSDGINALGWITDAKPVEQIGDALQSAQFFGNRVLREYKEKTPLHIEWIQSFYSLFKAMIAYVKQYHPTGLAWNNKSGVDAKQALAQIQSSSSSSSSSSANGTRPLSRVPTSGSAPPPPPPLPKFDNSVTLPSPKDTKSTSGDMNDVFSQLNQGEAVTSSLRRVDKSEMTHKNPSLRSSAIIPRPQRSASSSSGGAPNKKPKPEGMRTKKPARKELDGNKWIVEHFDSPAQPLTIDPSLSHSILISRCSGSTIRVRGKCNAISIDNSSRVSLILDSLVSSVDVIKSPNVAIQVLGSLPTILLDQVDGAQIYLGPESLATEVFTSKCSGVNVNIPDGPADTTEERDFRECAIPEQIRSVIVKGVVRSEIVEHSG